MAASLAEKILRYLDANGKADSLFLAQEWKEDPQKIVGAVKSLEALGSVSPNFFKISVKTLILQIFATNLRQFNCFIFLNLCFGFV